MQPRRVVFDSLSEMRLLAQNPLRYRRQILALKQFFSSRQCTVMMLDDRTADPNDLQLHSIAHGVITLDQAPRNFGAERRRLRVVKMRGIKFRGGYHDFELKTGGLVVFPRLIAAEHHATFDSAATSTCNRALDTLLGGVITPCTSTLLSGPSGVFKSTTVLNCMMAALERGERAAYYLFDEGLNTFISRGIAFGMDPRPYVASGQLDLRQIDPAELSPGEFACQIREAVEQRGSSFVAVDSLNAYMQAMPGDNYLMLQMHEILSYLNQQGVKTFLVLGQHGLVGDMRSDMDLSYLSDTIVLFRFFEAQGSVRSAISVVKSRTTEHERFIRELRLSSDGVQVGEALSDFEGVLSGLPAYKGSVRMLEAAPSIGSAG